MPCSRRPCPASGVTAVDCAALSVLEPPNKDRYPNQFLYLIETRQQINVVPFVVNSAEGVVFLKTIYPSSEYTRQYLEGTDEKQVR
jgi:hypothetical protein